MSSNILYNCGAAAAAVCVILIAAAVKQKKKTKKRCWSRAWINRRHEGKDVLSMLNRELKYEDPETYKNFLRLSSAQFEYLHRLIFPLLKKENTVMRESIPVRSKLEVTLRFLATGETFRSLMYYTRIHESSISRFVPLVCQALCDVLKGEYLKTPRCSEEWKTISDEFYRLWNFPHCLGALDGRHVEFRPPVSSGSYYHNYKGTNSIVLLGLVDANYKFTYVNIGVNGRISDGGVFNQCGLSKAITNNTLRIPEPEILPGQQECTPYVIVADGAFPLTDNIMKPYPERGLTHDQRIFNYRLSRARRIVENVFGILANRFRVLLNAINLCVDKVELITLTCVLLHNFLAQENGKSYTENEGNMKHLRRIERQSGNKSSQYAREVRENFKRYFSSTEGSVSWQEEAINNYNY